MASDHSSSDFIRKRRKNFRAVLGEAPDTVLDELDSLLLITREEYDKIEGMPNPSDKARELINTMLRKGERACQQFLTALHKLQETLPRLVEVLAEGCPSTSDDSSSEHPEGKRGLEEFSQNQEQEQEQQQVLNITPSSPLAVEADSSYKEPEAETGTEEFSPNQGPEQPKEECLEPELPALLSKEEKGRNLQEMLQNLGLQDLYTHDSSSEHPEGKRGLEEFSQNQEQEQQQVLNITPSSPLAVEVCGIFSKADSSYKETEAETGTEEFSPNQGPELPKEECLEPELPALLSKEEKGRNLQEMLQNLGLQDLYTRKLSLSEVLEIGPQTLVCTKPQSLLCVAEYFLKKLMILSLTARNVKCTGRVGRGVGNAEQTDFSDIFDLQEQADDTWCNPLDVITAVFLCADSFLQQEMMFKMSMCQFALPLLLPDCSREGSTLLLWAMRSIVKKWRPQSLEASKGFKEETMATMNLPVISFIRLGNNSTSKSKVLNEVLSNPHQNLLIPLNK
ncbi:caspase recruitment domain-containing protein 6 [Callorhinchus milii]|uniref:caspase recruitment domain-containing protein 6 n=1 Tax=Callorhinchus milii TaxID=7868 RepID=UPI001C3F79F7|nr:caspase recruitment domain-containing protein 6 [Callorhinchus milii]